MFKEPGYDWLRDKVNKLGKPDLVLPPKITKREEPIETDFTQQDSNNKLEKNNYCIDIETEPISDNPLKALMIKTLQLDNEFIPVTKSNLPTLKEELQNKELIA